MAHNFKMIQKVPEYKDFVDFTLSRTQRKTPTVIHRHFAISRIREFYIRKVKFTQQNFHERLTKIINDFPKIDEVHPFYSDLINTLYDRDHYKVALSQVNMARNLIDNIAKEYIRLLKYGDSLYRCKCLKKVALGRMVSALKTASDGLVYLEEVRQHMSRLPSIDPNMRTLILCGFPNVGKSSFLNSVSHAEVDVQPYPFTTKSLYVGHTDYNYLRWQIIDTPGILDHPLEDRNTIEMQSITALAHIQACIVFMLDISEQCGHSIDEQIRLFKNLTPLFSNKPALIGLNKTDIVSPTELSNEHRSELAEMEKNGIFMVPLSTKSGDGVMKLKKEACDRLLHQRVVTKINSKKLDGIVDRLHVAVPTKCSTNERPTYKIPPMKDFPEVYESGQLVIPEIFNGKNIVDFLDPHLKENLKNLLKEEKLREDAGFYDPLKYTKQEIEKLKLGQKLKEERKVAMMEHASSKNANSTYLSRETARKRKNSRINEKEDSDSDDDDTLLKGSNKIDRNDGNLAHELTLAQSGVIGEKAKVADTLRRAHMKKVKKFSRKGDADRHIYDMKPKHLFVGKRKLGKTQRR